MRSRYLGLLALAVVACLLSLAGTSTVKSSAIATAPDVVTTAPDALSGSISVDDPFLAVSDLDTAAVTCGSSSICRNDLCSVAGGPGCHHGCKCIDCNGFVTCRK